MEQLSRTSKQTKKNIVESFWRLYEKKPIEKITVREICECSGYNRATFYRYFTDVYQIKDETCKVISENASKYYDKFIEGILKENNFEMKTHAFNQFYNAIWIKHERYLKILLWTNRDQQFYQNVVSLTKSHLFELLLQHGFSKNDSYTYFLAETYADYCVTTSILWLNQEPQNSLKLLQLLLGTLFEGIIPTAQKQVSEN